jgi:hypothetical protein
MPEPEGYDALRDYLRNLPPVDSPVMNTPHLAEITTGLSKCDRCGCPADDLVMHPDGPVVLVIDEIDEYLWMTPQRRVAAVYPPPVLGHPMPLAGIFDPAHERYLEGKAVRVLYEMDHQVRKYLDGCIAGTEVVPGARA